MHSSGEGAAVPQSEVRSGFSSASVLILGGSIAAALALKGALYLMDAVPFNSDEAIIGLMARHILEGHAPVFFYGQAYMGSLDAWLIAGLFAVFGPGVVWIRVVQVVLYAVFIATSWLLARAFFPDSNLARWAAVLAVVPPVLVTTYTSVTLGGYGEILVLGNLCLLFAQAAFKHPERLRWWALLGLAAGVGFWTLGLIAVYLLPIGIVYLWRFRVDKAWLSGGIAALLGFMVGSAPWWLYNWTHGGAALAALTGGAPIPSTAGERLLGLLVLGLPAAFGVRFPWSGEFLIMPMLFLAVVLYCAVVLHLFVRYRGRGSELNLGAKLLLGLTLTLLAAFVASGFGIDSTGRYLLPLYLPLLLASAYLLERAWRWRRQAALLALAGFFIVNGWGTAQAAASTGFTTQFDPISHFDNQHDQALIEFLEAQRVNSGYANYWVSYRIAFLSAEQIQLSPQLPYKRSLSFTAKDSRVPQYEARADASERVVYITTKHPELDRRLQQAFDELGVDYSQTDIGPYHVFYDLSRPVRPHEVRPFISP